uniref:Uncharacterized protein n=1 Tax=Eutreptiella gymnastica TaxID=73025 RepID=A0A7S1IGT9_9EUGL
MSTVMNKPAAVRTSALPRSQSTRGLAHNGMAYPVVAQDVQTLQKHPAYVGPTNGFATAQPQATPLVSLALVITPVFITGVAVAALFARKAIAQLAPVQMEQIPIALAVTSGAKALPKHTGIHWDPIGILDRLVSFEREAELSVLHGRLAVLKIARSAGHRLDHGWDYMQSLVFSAILGLGAPEIAVVVITAGLLLGPKKVAELAKDAGKITGQLKDVTKDFNEAVQDGMRESQEAKAAAPPAPPAAAPPATPAAPEAPATPVAKPADPPSSN